MTHTAWTSSRPALPPQRPGLPTPPRPKPRRLGRGLSLVETLIAMTITAMLLTATMVAIDASFKAYASAAEQASAHSGLRMVSHRLLTLVRTSTAHGPLEPAAGPPEVTLSNNILTSPYLEVLDANDNIVRIEWRSVEQELWITSTPAAGGTAVSQPLLSGVTDAKFFCVRQLNDDNLWQLQRGTMDVTVRPGADATLQIESGSSPPVRLIASTKPRKLE